MSRIYGDVHCDSKAEKKNRGKPRFLMGSEAPYEATYLRSTSVPFKLAR